MASRQSFTGWSEVTRGLGTLDREVFEAIADSPSPLLDTAMPALTRAADHSRLWIAIAGALAATSSPSARRAATRGLVSLAVTSLLTNQVAKRLWHRARPDRSSVPLIRRSRRVPTSNSLPSGHAASAAAFAVGAGLENPALGMGLALLAGLVGLSRVATGVHYPGDVLAGFAAGAGVSVLGGRLVPPVVPAHLPCTEPLRVPAPPRPDGAGVVVVVNPASRSGTAGDTVSEIRALLPSAEIVELDGDDHRETMIRAARRAAVLAVAGGDGTVGCAADVAVAQDIPLAVFPGGTFNHFARDIGCATVADTAEAIRSGSVWLVDVVRLNGEQTIVNTASFGAYPHYVRIRETVEHRVGKTLAGFYAMVHTLLRGRPVRIRYDGKSMQTSLFFIGNSVYLPSGFAPSRRTRMDDGLVDVRILETGRRWSRLRILAALASGRLERSPLYHELQVPEFSMEAVDTPITLARDGEVDGDYRRMRFTADYRALQVYRPAG